MRAIVYERYGAPEVLKIIEAEKPAAGEGEVLVRVLAASVNLSEWYAMTGLAVARLGNGITRPKQTRLGVDFAGVVEAVGHSVTDFRPGDEVFGARSGALAEYVAVRNAVVHKPAKITFEEAAAVPVAGITALQGLRDHGQLKAGQSVLIHGASGGVGAFAVQIAKALGAEVTAVCSTRNVERAKLLGADEVVDYTREDFTRRGQHYDLMLEVSGGRSWFNYRRALKPEATLVIVGGPRTPVVGPLGHIAQLRLASVGASQKVRFFIAKITRDDLLALNAMIESDKLKPWVEQTYPLAQVSEAMWHIGWGHARGKIVVTLNEA